MFENPYEEQMWLMPHWLLANANCDIHKGNGATTVASVKLANMTDQQYFTVYVKNSFLRKVIIK